MEENYALGGSVSFIKDAISRSNAKAEELFSDEVNFDTRKGLNRSDKVVPKEVIEEIENKGMSLERLESLGLPIYKYQTQITVHGVFDSLGTSRVGLGHYKNLMLNQNKTLGIKYNAIDSDKKKIIAKALRFDNILTKSEGEKSFYSSVDSKGFVLSKYKTSTDKPKAIEYAKELIELSKKIPQNFIGTKNVSIFSVFGMYYAELSIGLKAIRQENLWSFISAITDGRITESKYHEMLVEETKNDEELKLARELKQKQDIEITAKQAKELSQKSPYPKLTQYPSGEDYIIAFVSGSYMGTSIKVYYVLKNKTGRKVYYIKNFNSWDDIEKNIDKDKKGNFTVDEAFEKRIKAGIDKDMYYLIYDKQELKSMYEKPISKVKIEPVKLETDNVLIDTDRYQLIKSKHTKTDEDIFLLKLKNRVERDDYKTIDRNVKNIKGYYSSFVGAFVLKTAISVNEIEKLIEGTSLELKRSNDTGIVESSEVVENEKKEEVKKDAIKDVLEGTNLTISEATEQVEKGMDMEEEHRDTLEKLAKGEVTVDEAVAMVATDHIINEDPKYYTKHEENELSEKANVLLSSLIYEYDNSDDDKKRKLVKIVKDNIERNESSKKLDLN